jgi:hypothetical protein
LGIFVIINIKQQNDDRHKICADAYLYIYDVISKKNWIKLINWWKRALFLFLNSENEEKELIIKFHVELTANVCMNFKANIK